MVTGTFQVMVGQGALSIQVPGFQILLVAEGRVGL